jgi:Na+/phosphate symporter
MLELLALYLAGLAFFFSGISGISDNLRQMSGQRFRQALGRLTHRRLWWRSSFRAWFQPVCFPFRER